MSSVMSLADKLYTSTFMSGSGISHPYVDTGIQNSVDTEMLMKKKRVFWASLYFDADGLTDDSQKKLDKMIEMIKDNKQKPYFVTVIGHTSGLISDDHDIELNAWSSFWHNMNSSKATQESVAHSVNKKITFVYNLLKQSDIETDRIYTENRLDRDPTSTEATKHGKSLNNRVAIALYY